MVFFLIMISKICQKQALNCSGHNGCREEAKNRCDELDNTILSKRDFGKQIASIELVTTIDVYDMD